jgi:NhaC family Na+:H+ antiporter
MVGALAGTWLVSGIINDLLRFTNSKSGNILASHRDNMLYNFIATGSSWTTSATVGIALIGVGGALGFDLGMVAGAVISGAYFEINYHQCQTQLTLPLP